tara:strand:- start:538 stop:876 length:339 start_codon:yes stop_codon:yes gene_type:complete
MLVGRTTNETRTGEIKVSDNTLVKKVEEEAREQMMFDYIKSLKTIEDEMEPYKEAKKDLRDDYYRRGLTKNDVWLSVKAYRLMRSLTDKEIEFMDLQMVFDRLSGERARYDD